MKIVIHQMAVIAIILSSCQVNRQTVNIIESYDDQGDITTLRMIPHENVQIPGKWTIEQIIESSGQVFLKQDSSVTIAIAQKPKTSFSFYTEQQSNSELIESYTDWETSHWVEAGLNYQILKEENGQFTICKLITPSFSNLFLFGIRHDILVNYMIASKAGEEEQISFLEELYRSNE